MPYTSIHEAIVGVLRGSGILDIDWATSPYYVEASEPLPEAPFPYVVYELPKSEVEHQQGVDAFVVSYRPAFYVVGLESMRTTVLSPFASAAVSPVAFLDSKRGTDALPNGYTEFDGSGFECISFYRTSDYLGKFADRSPYDAQTGKGGERVWMLQADYLIRVTAP